MSDLLVVLVVTLYSTADGSTRIDISPPMSMETCIKRKPTVDIPRSYTLLWINCETVRPEIKE